MKQNSLRSKGAQTNTQLFTKNNSNRRRNDNAVGEDVVFDIKSRLEFLTGFEKRNKLKKQKAIERLKTEEKALKCERKRQKRLRINEALQEVTREIEEQEKPYSALARTDLFTDAQDLNTTTVIIEPIGQHPISFVCGMSDLIGGIPESAATMSSLGKFRSEYSFDERVKKSQYLRDQYPSRIPIICERLNSSDLQMMSSERLLVPGDFNVGNLTTVIRNRIHIPPERALFLFVNNSLLPAHQPLAAVYKDKHDLDGFLYVIYSGENTFGSSVPF